MGIKAAVVFGELKFVDTLAKHFTLVSLLLKVRSLGADCDEFSITQ